MKNAIGTIFCIICWFGLSIVVGLPGFFAGGIGYCVFLLLDLMLREIAENTQRIADNTGKILAKTKPDDR